jgi:type II secretory pathway pseudopilin PulG
MLIATFTPSTGWAGKTITYDGRQFVLEGFGPVTAAAVLDYDGQGHLEWSSEQAKELVVTTAGAQPVAPASPSQTSAVPASARKKSISPVLVVVVVAIVAVIAIIAIAGAMSSSNGAATQAGSAVQGAQQDLDQAQSLVTVFTWPGGGADNDIRNSSPFTLQGGHQVVTVTSTPAGSDPSMTSLGWTLESADGAGEMEMLDPASTGTAQSDYYLPAGSYYLSSNTIGATWTVTVAEMR